MKKATLKLASPDLFNKIQESAAAVGLTELQFKITPEDGFILSKLDSSKAAHLRIEIPPSEFEEYNVPEERVVCIDMESLTLIKKRFEKRKEAIDIVLKDNEMIISNDGKPRREFSLSLLVPAEDTKELNLELPTLVVVDAEEMNEQVKDLIGIAQHAIVEVSDGLLTVNGEGDKGKVSVQTSLTELDMVKRHEGPNAKSMYAVAYLEEAFKFLKQFDVVAMRFTDNKPLTLTTIIGKEGAIRILIAPRVERG